MKLRSSLGRFESIVFIVSIGCILLYPALEYLHGRFDWVLNLFLNADIGIGYMFLVFILILMPILLAAIVIFRSFIVLYQRSFQRFWQSLLLGILILAIAGAIHRFASSPSAFTLGYAARLRSQVDARTLQEWAISTINATPKEDSFNVKGQPPGTGLLAFAEVSVWPKPDASQSYVRLVERWNFFGNYGMLVGGPEFHCPGWSYQLAPGVCVAGNVADD